MFKNLHAINWLSLDFNAVQDSSLDRIHQRVSHISEEALEEKGLLFYNAASSHRLYSLRVPHLCKRILVNWKFQHDECNFNVNLIRDLPHGSTKHIPEDQTTR